MTKSLVISVAVAVVVGSALLWPVGGKAQSANAERYAAMDLSQFSSSQPAQALHLVFIHHSVGGQLLADPGPAQDVADSIYATHPNGGGLRRLLERDGYLVGEASYGSRVGEQTDLLDWLPKFRTELDAILRTKHNDVPLPDAKRNHIVVFKSCYPNNSFASEGIPPGRAAGPELTVWNVRAAFAELRSVFLAHPEVLFVYLTAPPNAPGLAPERLVEVLLRKVLRRPAPAEVAARQARLARAFNRWVAAPDGWLGGYPGRNVAVFDYYDLLTEGESNLSAFPSGDGSDSHPNADGQRLAAQRFAGFLNRAVRRAEIAE